MHVGPLGHRLLLNLPVARICSFEGRKEDLLIPGSQQG